MASGNLEPNKGPKRYKNSEGTEKVAHMKSAPISARIMMTELVGAVMN
jgi:hypothetical protein